MNDELFQNARLQLLAREQELRQSRIVYRGARYLYRRAKRLKSR